MEYKKKILLVDDKPVIAKMLSMHLTEFDCIYFSNPLKCIKWLMVNERPALIISDLKMPSYSGRKFLSYIKGSDQYKNIPFMILSSEEDPEDKAELFQKGCIDYIMKPFNPLDVRLRVLHVVNR